MQISTLPAGFSLDPARCGDCLRRKAAREPVFRSMAPSGSFSAWVLIYKIKTLACYALRCSTLPLSAASLTPLVASTFFAVAPSLLLPCGWHPYASKPSCWPLQPHFALVIATVAVPSSSKDADGHRQRPCCYRGHNLWPETWTRPGSGQSTGLGGLFLPIRK